MSTLSQLEMTLVVYLLGQQSYLWRLHVAVCEQMKSPALRSLEDSG